MNMKYWKLPVFTLEGTGSLTPGAVSRFLAQSPADAGSAKPSNSNHTKIVFMISFLILI